MDIVKTGNVLSKIDSEETSLFAIDTRYTLHANASMNW